MFNISAWLKGLTSLFGPVSTDGSLPEQVSASIPFGGPDPAAPDQPNDCPLDIPDDIAAKGYTKDISTCHKRIRDAWPIVKSGFEAAHPGWTLKVDYCWRSKELQFELFKKGRTLLDGKWVVTDPSHKVTDKDGSQPSHHQCWPPQAADVYAVDPTGRIAWTSPALYDELGRLWADQGLISGANWKFNWHDPPHVQVAYAILP